MKKIIFVCHGNICRSVAAEYIAKSLTNEFEICSRATSLEEIGNDIYPPMKMELRKNAISFDKHHATRISKLDYDTADYIFYMDSNNKYNLNRLFGENNKALPVFMYSNGIFEIEDPWYTGRYDKVVTELTICIKDILKNIQK